MIARAHIACILVPYHYHDASYMPLLHCSCHRIYIAGVRGVTHAADTLAQLQAGAIDAAIIDTRAVRAMSLWAGKRSADTRDVSCFARCTSNTCERSLARPQIPGARLLLTAAYTAGLECARGTNTAKTLWTEVIMQCSPVRGVGKALQNFGLAADCTQAAVVGRSPEACKAVAAQLGGTIVPVETVCALHPDGKTASQLEAAIAHVCQAFKLTSGEVDALGVEGAAITKLCVRRA